MTGKARKPVTRCEDVDRWEESNPLGMNGGPKEDEKDREGKLEMKPKSRKFSRRFFPIPRAWRQKQLEGHMISR